MAENKEHSGGEFAPRKPQISITVITSSPLNGCHLTQAKDNRTKKRKRNRKEKAMQKDANTILPLKGKMLT